MGKLEGNYKIFILSVLIIFLRSITLSAQSSEINFIESTKMRQKYVAISPLLSPRLCFGIMNSAKYDDDRCFESIYYMHAFETFSTFKVYGIAYRVNGFVLRDTRSGMFVMANLGIDYIQNKTICFGFSDSCKEEIVNRIFVNAAIGAGYSFELKNDSYLRVELDFGLKWFLSNFYISYIW